jgi:hypothetical protein
VIFMPFFLMLLCCHGKINGHRQWATKHYWWNYSYIKVEEVIITWLQIGHILLYVTIY